MELFVVFTRDSNQEDWSVWSTHTTLQSATKSRADLTDDGAPCGILVLDQAMVDSIADFRSDR